jgi:CheY-like chemotaxis protein
MPENRSLAGLRVLVVEDETLLSMMIEDMLTDLGCTVVGTGNELQKACSLASKATVDVGILDVNLDGLDSGPVAEQLAARGVPFVLATGYGTAGVSRKYKNAPALIKPFNERDLARALTEAVDGAGHSGG